jgi:two-component system, cell cycle response regulator
MVGMTAASRRVLIVDDDEISLRMMASALAAHFAVLTASDGSIALDLLARESVDAIIADQFMPGMTGAELLDRGHALRPAAARVLVTASDRLETLGDAVNRARVHRFLTKPVRLPELPALIEGAIREASLEAENTRLLAELAEANSRLEAEVRERTLELQRAVAKLEQLALRDGLTGLYNHRYLQQALDAELSRAKRHSHDLSVLFIDVDHFKAYNDRNGHPAGDALLQAMAELLGGGRSGSMRVRASDVVARYGGEEFMLILPETGIHGAATKAEYVRKAVAGYDFEHGSAQPSGRVSVSIGVAAFPTHGSDKQSLIAAADRELYRAKALGRDRVCVGGEP